MHDIVWCSIDSLAADTICDQNKVTLLTCNKMHTKVAVHMYATGSVTCH